MRLYRVFSGAVVVLFTLTTLLVAPLQADAAPAPVQRLTVSQGIDTSVQFWFCHIPMLCRR